MQHLYSFWDDKKKAPIRGEEVVVELDFSEFFRQG